MKLAISELFFDLFEEILAAEWVDCLEISGGRVDFDVNTLLILRGTRRESPAWLDIRLVVLKCVYSDFESLNEKVMFKTASNS